MTATRLFSLLFAILAAGCGELPSMDPGVDPDLLGGERIEIIRLDEYFPPFNSGFMEQTRRVVQSQAVWEQVWARMWANHHPVPPVPSIDFEREMVLLAAMGGRSSGGYRVQVQAAAALADRVAVRVIETSPGGNCIVTAALTEPVDVVRIPRTPLPVEFRTVTAVHRCE